MRFPYVVIYQDFNREENLFYDCVMKRFLITKQAKQTSHISLMAGANILFYVIMRDRVLTSNLSPLVVSVITIIIGICLGIILLRLLSVLSNKLMKREARVIHLSDDQIRNYIVKGRRQLPKIYGLTLLLIVFCALSIILLLLWPEELILHISAIGLILVTIIFLGTVRPLSREKVYRNIIQQMNVH